MRSVGSEEMHGRSVLRVRVHIALVALLAAIICGTAGSMLLVQIDGSRRIVRDSAFVYMDVVGLRVADRTAALVGPIINGLRVLATRPALLETTTPDDREIIPGIVETLRQYRDVYGMHVSYADGNFLWVESLMAVPPALRGALAAPQNATYRLTDIRHDGEHRVQRRWWLDAGGALLTEIDTSIDPPYDPRNRPWYREAHVWAHQASRRCTCSPRFELPDIPSQFHSLARSLVSWRRIFYSARSMSLSRRSGLAGMGGLCC
jgi:hypothetical protein